MKTESTNQRNIAVIGPTQAGKTCLAVGLFSTSRPNFTIETVDAASRAYLDDRRAEIIQGGWPDATIKGSKREIRLYFQKKKESPVCVSFPEFSGELLADDASFKDFANRSLRDLDGAVILVNPGAEAFLSDNARLFTDTMTQYKRAISFLRDENSGSRDAFVALAVTASDRLSGDLRGNQEKFDTAIEEIANTLSTSGCRWKRFDISVTGHLERQDNPKLARGGENTAAEPFLWLLDGMNWRPRRQAALRKLRNIAVAVLVAAALGGVWLGVDIKNASDEIGKIERELVEPLRSCLSHPKPNDEDLATIRDKFMALRKPRRLCNAVAHSVAARHESDIWRAHEKRIRTEWDGITKDPAKNGGNCAKVDAVFDAWGSIAAAASKDVRDSAIRLKSDWEKLKPSFKEQFDVTQLLEGVQRPLDERVAMHGVDALAAFPELYRKLETIQPSTFQTNLVAKREKLAEDLDARVGREFREFVIPAFAEAAATNATADAARELLERLDAWHPATKNGIAEGKELKELIDASMPEWRIAYETTTLKRKVEEATSSGDIGKLAMLFPPRVATNEFLSAKLVEEYWTNRVAAAFDMAVDKFISEFVANVQNRKGCPAFTDEDRRKFDQATASIGEPFHAEEILVKIEHTVVEAAEEWNVARKAECEEWVKKEVRPDRPRTGENGLWNEYEKAKARFSKEGNPFFMEVASIAVYKVIENWFEEDVAAFESDFAPQDGLPIWDDDEENRVVRYKNVESRFQHFRELCRKVARDKNPAEGTWAHQFARLCDEKGAIDRIHEAFPQRIEATKLEAMIDYSGNFPVNYTFTSVAAYFVVIPYGPNGEVQKENRKFCTLVDVDGDNAPKDNTKTQITQDKKWKEIWCGHKICETGLFQDCSLVVVATDYNKWIGSGPKTGRIYPPSICFWKKNPMPLIEGEFSLDRFSGTKTVKVSVRLTAKMSGETPATLLEEAKRIALGRGK